MTSAFSWQNSICLCRDSFCTPRPVTVLQAVTPVMAIPGVLSHLVVFDSL